MSERPPTYLLDTSVLSALVREPRGPTRQRLEQVGESAAVTSIVVAAELRFGAVKSGSARLGSAVDQLLDLMVILPFEARDDVEYAAIRSELERAGTPIGPNDLLIASQARRRGLVVVTAKAREFRRVPSLIVEDWTSSA